MKFPLIHKTGAEAEPRAKLYYLVASNGVFQVRDTGFYRAVTRAHGPIPGLLPEGERLELGVPRLPRALLERVLNFLYAVYQLHGGEAIALLFYRPQSRQYRVEVPRQTVPGYVRADGSWTPIYALDYRNVERPEGFLRFGTIHSHAEFPAYSSATDCADESFEDGLHVVFGHLHRRQPSRSASFVANGVRFGLEPERVLEPCGVPRQPTRREWLARVEREERAGPVELGPRLGPGPASAWTWSGYGWEAEQAEEQHDGVERHA